MKTSRSKTRREIHKRAGSWVLSGSQADQVRGKTGNSGYNWLPWRPHPQHMQGMSSLPHILASDYHRPCCGQAWLLKSLRLFQKETTRDPPHWQRVDRIWDNQGNLPFSSPAILVHLLPRGFPCFLALTPHTSPVTVSQWAKFSASYLKASFPCSPVMLWNSVTVTVLWQSTSFSCFSYVYQSFSFTESFWNCLRLEKLKVSWSQIQVPISESSV